MTDYKKEAREVRKTVLGLIHRGGTSHIASCFSCVDLAVVLYNNLKDGDEVVWSAGWKAALIYTMLRKQEKITEEQLNSFPNPPFLGLAETTIPGVWCNGGSMSHGLAIAVGMALTKKEESQDGSIYCIGSDGELHEGSSWEAILQAGHDHLENLVYLVDYNKWCAMGRTNEVLNLEPLQDKFTACNWTVVRVDGHDHAHIERALKQIHTKRPLAIICDTVKGSGGPTACKMFEEKLLFHYKHISDEEAAKALELLDKDAVPTLPQRF